MTVEKVLVEAFQILENGEEMGISFPLDAAPVETAAFVYDGGNCAILMRNQAQAFLFTNIVEPLRRKLLDAGQVMIIEEKGDEIVNSYMAEVEKAAKIPVEDTLADELVELMDGLKEQYGEEGVARIAKELWEVE